MPFLNLWDMVGVFFIMLILSGFVWLMGGLSGTMMVMLILLFTGAVVFAKRGGG